MVKGEISVEPVEFSSGKMECSLQAIGKEEIVEDNDEYSVYSKVINNYFSGDKLKLVVVDEVTSGLSLFPSASGTSSLDGIFGTSRLALECVDDFNVKNTMVSKLGKSLLLEKKYEIVAGEVEQIDADMRSGKNGWEAYFKRYPKSQGLISLSRVGFCKNKTMAVVYIANRFSADGGWGKLVLLRTTRSRKWQIVKEVVLWIS